MLQEIIQILRDKRRPAKLPYHVPGLWIDCVSIPAQQVDPHQFYAEKLESILAADPQPVITGPPGGEWTQQAIIYNMFPRVFAAWDHSGKGQVSTQPREDGWRDTGTLLKAIALLPYIKFLGCNTVHLLPVTAVGQDGKKGTLGSPYAIRNPYRLDENLAEPALGLSAEDLFLGFVEAAHHLGIRVVMEFVLRTASKDSDLVKDHPEWFYWIKADIPDRKPGTRNSKHFGSPLFDANMLGLIKWKVGENDFDDLPPPSKEYRAMYTQPPRPECVYKIQGRWIGELDDGTLVRIPGAFSDWPPDDSQPPWTDVTYLRMFDHADFNYMAYNTLRMYDNRLALPENINHSLWERVIGIIPYYQETFGIDGVMIDMGHSLPAELKQQMVQRTRAIDPDFAFWDENFLITQHSRDEGYNAVMGYLVFDYHQPEQIRNFLHWIAFERAPVGFFATPENHNTPRAATRQRGPGSFQHYALVLSIATSGIPFIHNGFELREQQPINTGLGFSAEQLRQYPAEKLPLFSQWAFKWTREDNLVDGVSFALRLRQEYADLLADPDPATWFIGWSNNPHILVITRHKGERSLTFVLNTDMAYHQAGRIVIGGQEVQMQGLWGTTEKVTVYHDLNFFTHLLPGYTLILRGNGLPINGVSPVMPD